MMTTMGKKILITDDSEFFRTSIGNMLLGAGHLIGFARDGREAVEELSSDSKDYDLLLLDLKMPVADGFEVLKWINEKNRLGRPPVFVITGAYEASAVLERVKNLGAAAFLPKGAPKEHFIFRVNKLLYPDRRQRSSPRILTNIPVEFTSDGTIHKGCIVNMSETGVFISTDSLSNPGDSIRMKFSIPGDDNVIMMEGRIVWISNLMGEEAIFNGMGIQFTRCSADDRTRISSFVRDELNRFF